MIAKKIDFNKIAQAGVETKGKVKDRVNKFGRKFTALKFIFLRRIGVKDRQIQN